MTKDLDWRQLAACHHHPRLHPDTWFPDPSDTAARAAAAKVCRRECPVIRECALYALQTKPAWGVWGGMTQKQLSTILNEHASTRRWAPNRLVQPCGTPAAYKRHLEHGERPCAPCLAANNRSQQETAAHRRQGAH